MKLDDVYYDCGDPEILRHTDEQEAIETFLDEYVGNFPNDGMPEFVDLQKYVRMKVVAPTWMAERIVSQLMETLCEEYGGPDGDECEASPEMTKLAEEFVEAFCALFVPWSCVPDGPPTKIDVKLFLQASEFPGENVPRGTSGDPQ